MSEPDKHTLCLLNGEIVDESQLQLSLQSSAVTYGTGCFETFAVENGAVCDLSLHLRRLQEGLKYLGCRSQLIPSKSELKNHLSNLYHQTNVSAEFQKVRIQAVLDEYGGYASSGEQQNVLILMTALPFADVKKEIRLISSDVHTLPEGIKPLHLKLSNMLHYRDAHRQAADAGADDALLFNVEGFIAETSISNIFWKRGDVIYTPSAQTGLLPGITRKSLMNFVGSSLNPYQLDEGFYPPDRLADAESVWVTNSLRGIRFVRSLDGRDLGRDPAFEKELIAGYGAFREGEKL
jgi:branched-subunit amino acid aminotransferase/4-amino-4-deoxychorismate lyase